MVRFLPADLHRAPAGGAARWLLLAAIGWALAASGCAHHRGGRPLSLAVDAAVEVLFIESARSDGERVAALVPDALAVVTGHWGQLRSPLRVEVLPDHGALEKAVDRRGYAWLRAWARYGEVWIQAPSTWGVLGASDGAVRELLVHELTHVVMYQRAAHEGDWRFRQIPLWFREGMASWTARQGYRRSELAEIARWLREHPCDDLVGDADAWVRDAEGLVYSAGHHAFTFLVDRYGAGAVKNLLARMYAASETFPEAFEGVIGISMNAFEAEFGRFVRMEGWLRSRPPRWDGTTSRGATPRAPARAVAAR